jgi:hypothetical protein
MISMVEVAEFLYRDGNVAFSAVKTLILESDRGLMRARPPNNDASAMVNAKNPPTISSPLSLDFIMEPLTVGQQLLNQRLLAEHCLPEHKLHEVWKQLGERENMGADSLAETIGICNAQMKHIGLEIRCVAMKNQNINKSQSNMSDTDTVASQNSSNTKTIKYYAIVNSYPDEVGKKSFMQSMAPGEISYIKLILEHLIEEPQSLATLLNLRPDNDQEKVSLPTAEQIVYKLLDAKWLEWSTKNRNNSAPIQLAPRTYMELSHLLTEELGMEKESLPQMIIH